MVIGLKQRIGQQRACRRQPVYDALALPLAFDQAGEARLRQVLPGHRGSAARNGSQNRHVQLGAIALSRWALLPAFIVTKVLGECDFRPGQTVLHRRDEFGGRLSLRNAAHRPTSRSSPSTTIQQVGHRDGPTGLGSDSGYARSTEDQGDQVGLRRGRLTMRLMSISGIGEPLSRPRRGSWPRPVPMTSLCARGVAKVGEPEAAGRRCFGR